MRVALTLLWNGSFAATRPFVPWAFGALCMAACGSPMPAPPIANIPSTPTVTHPRCTDIDACVLECEQGFYAGCDGVVDQVVERQVEAPDLKKAFACVLSACANGNSAGCVRAGLAYRDAEGVRRDVSKATEFFGRACTMGDGEGCAEKGALVFAGRGVRADTAAGLALLEKACELEYGPGCASLAAAYGHGYQGIAIDQARSEALFSKRDAALKAGCSRGSPRWCLEAAKQQGLTPLRPAAFRRVCDMGNPVACQLAGQDYAAGNYGTPKDIRLGMELLARACDLGAHGACEYGAHVARSGVGNDAGLADRLHARFLAFLGRRCDSGEANSCARLGDEYSSERCIPRDIKRSEAAYVKAAGLYAADCEAGEELACLTGAKILRSHQVGEPEPRKSAALLEKGCELKPSGSCCEEGAMAYFRGDGIPRDGSKVLSLLERSCAASPGQSTCIFIGRMHQFGYVVVQDLNKAEQTYRRACDTGNHAACELEGDMIVLGQAKGDLARALAVFDRACVAEVRTSCDRAGAVAEHGGSGKKDLGTAVQYYRRSCELGHCGHFALLLASGRGVAKSVAGSTQALKVSCDAGELGPWCSKWLEQTKGDGTPEDNAERAESLEHACVQGDPAACLKLPKFSRSLADDERACRWEPKTVFDEPDSAGPCMVAAYAKELGLKVDGGKLRAGGTKDLAGALELYEKACFVFRYLRACGEAGRMILAGQGAKPDKVRAAPLLRAACMDGSASACGALGTRN